MGLNASQTKLPVTCPICSRNFAVGSEIDIVNKHIDECISRQSSIQHTERTSCSLQPFFEKHRELRKALDTIRVPWQEGAVSLQFQRDVLLNQSCEKLESLTIEQLRSELKIMFVGEVVSDAGGAAKEWLSKLNHLLLASETGLYRLTDTEIVAYRFQPCLQQELLQLAHLHGMVIGKALLEGIPLNCPLSRVLFKQLLDKPLSIHDLIDVERPLYSSLRCIYENNITDMLFNTFIVEETLPSGKVMVELCRGGREITVSEENKANYISLMTEWVLVNNSREAITALKSGFDRVIPPEILSDLSSDELELALCGLQDIDIDDWRRNTDYRGEFSAEHFVVRCFWKAVSEFERADIALLLQFVMGTNRLPVEGFRGLKTLRGDDAKFTLESVDFNYEKYPRAHTCFNRLDLPIYPNYQMLKDNLIFVIRYHSEGFGIE